MDRHLFRKEALSKYLRADAPGALVTVTPPSTSLAFATLLVLFALLGSLLLLGRADAVAEGVGIVLPDEPPIVLRAPFSGTVASVARGIGDHGRAGEMLLRLDDGLARASSERCAAQLAIEEHEAADLGRRLDEWKRATTGNRDAALGMVLLEELRMGHDAVERTRSRCDGARGLTDRSVVVFPVEGIVTELAARPGSELREGDAIATLLPATARLKGYLALAERYRAEVSPGQSVRVRFDALPYDEVGAGHARVAHVLSGLPSGVRIDAAPGARVFAELSLDAMPTAAPPQIGMTFTADVLTGRRTVLSLLFGGGSDEP